MEGVLQGPAPRDVQGKEGSDDTQTSHSSSICCYTRDRIVTAVTSCAVCAQRVVPCLFNDDGSPNKWWMCFAKKKFLGMELK